MESKNLKFYNNQTTQKKRYKIAHVATNEIYRELKNSLKNFNSSKKTPEPKFQALHNSLKVLLDKVKQTQKVSEQNTLLKRIQVWYNKNLKEKHRNLKLCISPQKSTPVSSSSSPINEFPFRSFTPMFLNKRLQTKPRRGSSNLETQHKRAFQFREFQKVPKETIQPKKVVPPKIQSSYTPKNEYSLKNKQAFNKNSRLRTGVTQRTNSIKDIRAGFFKPRRSSKFQNSLTDTLKVKAFLDNLN